MQVGKKLPIQTIEDLWIDLTVPRNLELPIERADKREVLPLLLKTLSQVDADRHEGKNSVHKIMQRSKSADSLRATFSDDGAIKPRNPHPEDLGDQEEPLRDVHPTRPVVLRKQVTDYCHRQQRPQHSEERRGPAR